MGETPGTFGEAISIARRKLALSQKDLAARVLKEDGNPISPQYLNDIEHDKRSPSSDQLVESFSSALGIDTEFLLKLTGRLPEDVRTARVDADTYKRAMAALRRELNLRPRRK